MSTSSNNRHSSKEELEQLASMFQKQYQEAAKVEDEITMIEVSGGLSICYSAMDNPELARKWAQQYIIMLSKRTNSRFVHNKD